MAWWQFWRPQEASDGSSSTRVPEPAGAVAGVGGPDEPALTTSASTTPDVAMPASPLATAGSPPALQREVADDAAPAVERPSGPAAWKVLPPPKLQADRPMPRTFESLMQRSLATHAPAESLARSTRPLSHEIRTDGPMGVVGQLMRVVSDPAAADAAVMTAGHDLVLRPRRLSTTELDADAAGPSIGAWAPDGSRPQPQSPAPTIARSSDGDAPTSDAPTGNALTGNAPTGNAPTGDAEAAMHAAAPSERPEISAPAIGAEAASFAPMLGDAPLAGAVQRSTIDAVGSPLRSLPALTTTSTPQLGSTGIAVGSSPSLLLAPPIARATDTASPATVRSATVSRQPDGEAPALPVGRRRHVVEVKSSAEPVTAAAFRMAEPASNAADPSLEPEEPTEVPADVVGPSTTADTAGSTVARIADPAAAGATSATLPTLGRRPGLGMPMDGLPESAVRAQRAADPFAGWNDDVIDLPLASTGSDGPGVGSSAFEAGEPSVESSAATAAAAGSLHRSADANANATAHIDTNTDTNAGSVASGDPVTLPTSDPATGFGEHAPETVIGERPITGAEPILAGVQRRADPAAAIDAPADAGGGLRLLALPAHAPTLGMRSLHRAVDDRSPGNLGAGAAPATTTVAMRWLVDGADSTATAGSRSALRRTADRSSGPTGSGGTGPAIGNGAGASVSAPGVTGAEADAAVRRTADTGDRAVIQGPGPATDPVDAADSGAAAGSFVASVDSDFDGPAVVARAVERSDDDSGSANATSWSSGPGAQDPVAVIRRLPATTPPERDGAFGSAGGAGVGDAWSGSFAVRGGASGASGTGNLGGAGITGGPVAGGDLAAGGSAWGAHAMDVVPRTLSRVTADPGTTPLPVVAATAFAGPTGAGSGDGPGAGRATAVLAPLPVASIGSASTAARQADSVAAGSGASAGGRGSDGAATAVSDGGAGGPYDVESSFVFREPDDGGQAAAPPAASVGDGGGDGGGGGASSGPGDAGAGGSTAQADTDLDKLAARIYDRLRYRIRRELLDDRERAGFALDRVR